MQELEFAERDEGGRLVVVAQDGTRYAVPVDDRLRAAMRPRRPAGTADGSPSATATPREVQAMIRAGQTAEEVATATGWEIARVRRFEGPVLAEREHVVGLAKAAHVRAQGRTDGSHTLERRARERLQSRGVPPSDTRWDAARTGGQGPWTVVVSFVAGGRERQATWHYDVQDRSIEALDDEARWLSEDEQALPGGLAGHPLLGTSHAEDETADLMATMRERRQARGRRHRRPDATRVEERVKEAGIDNEPLPLEDLQYDPSTMGDPPAAHPRGSAPEAPAPLTPVEDDADETESLPVAGSDAADGAPARPSRRERRRLRLPKLPPVLGDPDEESEDGDGPAPETAYARTHDPDEVTFEEFFGADDELEDAELEHADAELEDAEEQGLHLVEVEDEDEDENERSADAEDATAEGGQDPEPDTQDADVPDGPVDPEETDDADVRPLRTADEAGQDEEVAVEPVGAGRRKGRPSVPSWDDIMFGGGSRRG
ncbi:septation protein SepH [Ornithinimicrobium pekingense]|uniref:DUF3071 domain-containing protein n=1 Tax=Ornithinimicrobium pekingense TaxID=384677 RepID=A0ABQ2F7Z6_9MICO|nr:septation protein SepH [Ornithinimicrobium pekingense]GGK70320.1 hypothetical protein GCM10011509_18450 [Ornithinimicrobium pekingense]